MGGLKGTRAVIFGSAPCRDWRYLDAYLRADDFILCADGGRAQAEALGLTPDGYIGDGDSGGNPDGLPSVVLPEEKDDTDLEAAIQQAIHMGYRSLLLCGCTGGRADHHLANCFFLELIHRLGGTALMLDECNELRYLKGPATVKLCNEPEYRYLSLIPLDETITGVCERGTKYPLENHTMHRWLSLGVSNEILPGATAEIVVGSGAALLIRSDRKL